MSAHAVLTTKEKTSNKMVLLGLPKKTFHALNKQTRNIFPEKLNFTPLQESLIFFRKINSLSFEMLSYPKAFKSIS